MVVWRSVAIVRSADFRPAMSEEPAPAASARATRGESPRRRPRRVAGSLSQPPWRRLVNPYRPVEVLRPEQLEAIHDAAMRILESTGLEFMSDEAHRGVTRAQLARDLHAVDAREVDVEHRHVEALRRGGRERRGAVGHGGDDVAVGAKRFGQEFARGGIILREQHR